MVTQSLQKMFVHHQDENSTQNNSRKSTLSTSQSASLRNSIHIETESPKPKTPTPRINFELSAAKKLMKNKKHPLHAGGSSPGAIDMSDMFRDNKGRRTSILGIPAMQEEAIFTQVLAKNRSNVDRKFADLVRLVKEKDPERRFINGKLYDIQSLNSMEDLYTVRSTVLVRLRNLVIFEVFGVKFSAK